MNKDNLVKDVLSLIHNQNIEKEIKEVLSPKPEKRTSKTLKPKEKTYDDFETYYDQVNGEAVGIVYKNIVFLKKVTRDPLNWNEAVAYCKTIEINGIKARLCPVDDNWQTEFKMISKELYLALEKIGAEKLDYDTWASERSYKSAWSQRFSNGNVYTNHNKAISFYVRPVLLLH